ADSAAGFADINPLGVAGRHIEHRGFDQSIVNEDLARTQQLGTAQRQQTWIAGSGTHQVDRHACGPQLTKTGFSACSRNPSAMAVPRATDTWTVLPSSSQAIAARS